MQWTITYLVSLAIVLVLDAGWILLVARKQYALEASDVLRPKPQLPASVLFYVLFQTGLIVFGVLPMTRHFNGVHAVLATYRDVAAWGAGLGLFAYASFALTNQAIIKNWKYKLVISDLLWGAVLSAAGTLAGFAMYRLLA